MEQDRPAVALIGAGALGTALGRRLAARGYPVAAVLSRTEDRAQRLADTVGAPIATTSFYHLPSGAPLVFCCVPDDALAGLARALAALNPDWQGRTVAHTSGALPASALAPLGACGASLLSFHPLQTFAADSPPGVFDGIYVGLEGDEAAVALGIQVATDLGMRYAVLAAEAKARYHLAASMASNFVVTLLSLAGEVLTDAGVPRQQGAAMLRPLLEGTVRNLARHLPQDVLTGPIARGDRATVLGHTQALAEHLPQLVPVYAALGAETVRVAVRSGRLDPTDAQTLLDVLYAAVDPHRDTLL